MSELIGERMSEVTDMDSLIVMSNGEMYADGISQLIGRPLETGQLLYAKLRRALPEAEFKVEVIWNHFDNVVTGLIAGRKSGGETTVSFEDTQMARTDKVVYIDQLVWQIKEALSQP